MGKIYFASDFHLGAPNATQSLLREKCIVRWLDSIRHDAEEIYLVGDVFDFWFDYKRVVPKGYIRLLGKLAELRDQNIPIYFFQGNHDLWMFNYFQEELGIPIYNKPIQKNIKGKEFLIGHGDGLGPGDKGYKRMKKVFTNPFCQWLFRMVHPDLGIRIAQFWSGKSREQNMKTPEAFLGREQEWLYQYANKKLKVIPEIDYFIFGHRHLPLDLPLDNKRSRYINLGEWMNFNSYAVFDGEQLEINYFEKEPITHHH